MNRLSLKGTWTAGYRHFTADPDARLANTYRTKNANLVLTGTGKVTVLIDGRFTRTIDASGSPTPHRLSNGKDPRTARLELRLDGTLRRTPSPSDRGGRPILRRGRTTEGPDPVR